MVTVQNVEGEIRFYEPQNNQSVPRKRQHWCCQHGVQLLNYFRLRYSVGEIQLKAGHYRLTVQRNHAIFQEGKKEIPIPVTVEKTAIKPQRTVLDTIGSKLQAIELGGTTIRLVFSAKPATSVGE